MKGGEALWEHSEIINVNFFLLKFSSTGEFY
jgi:hypothetical protein